MWTWTSWQRWPMAFLELILQRSVSERVNWLSEKASRARSAERGRGRPTLQPWSVMLLSRCFSLFFFSITLWSFWLSQVLFYFLGGWRGRPRARDQEGSLWRGHAFCPSLRQWQRHSQIWNVCTDAATEPRLRQFQVRFLVFCFSHKKKWKLLNALEISVLLCVNRQQDLSYCRMS